MGKKKSEAVAAKKAAVAEEATADTAVETLTVEAPEAAAQENAAPETAAEAIVEMATAEAPAEMATEMVNAEATAATEQPSQVPAAEAAGPAGEPAAEPVDSIPLTKALESLLFITDHPLTLQQLCKFVGVPQKQSKRVTDAIAEIRRSLDEKQSAVQLVEVADGFQMGTRPNYAPIVKKLYTDKMTMRLSTAAHETLAIIAYKQPLTRAEIEQIRGVEVIAALETLVEKKLIEVVGRRETVGRPLMYGTTMEFLRHFGLRSLEDLPPIDSFVVEDAPLGAQPNPEGSPASADAEAPAMAGESAATEPAPAEAAPAAETRPLPSCVEAQSKEFAAGEEMAAERAAEAEAQSEPAAEP